MQGDRETIDVVVHSEDQVSLNLSSARIDGNQLLMRGALIDPEVPARINVALDTALSDELAGGAHVERGRDWSVEIHEEVLDVSWQIETIDLGAGFRLHDVRAKSPEGPIRAFGIEDLAASIGVGVAGAISVYLLWRSHKREQEAIRSRNAEIDRCYSEGGFPEIDYDVGNEASLSPDLMLKLKLSGKYKVRCRPASE